jgi:glycosyltransferase involved in cell wall biosynthesis
MEREIARRLLAESRICPIPIVFSAERIYALDRADALRLAQESSMPDRPLARLHVAPARLTGQPSRLRTAVKAVPRTAARYAYAVTPSAARQDMHFMLIHAREVIRKSFRKLAPAPPPHARAAIRNRSIETGGPEAGDVLWTCGNFSGSANLRHIAEARVRLGFSCVAICYNSISNEHSEWNPEKQERLPYECSLADLLDVANRILCFCEGTRSGLIAFASRCGRDTPDVRVVNFGRPRIAQDSSLPQELVGRRFVLSVGRFNRRTNLATLVKIWATLSEHPAFDLDLVILAKSADSDPAAIREVESSPLLQRRIFWFDECSDDMLGLLYRRAEALLCPGSEHTNFADGWGFPITSALALGTPVVVSDAGVLPAAALASAIILDSDSEDALRNAVLDLAASALPRFPCIEPATWDGAVETVVSHVIDVARASAA